MDMSDVVNILDGGSKVVAGASVLAMVVGSYIKWKGLDKVSGVLKIADRLLGFLALNMRKVK